MIRRHDNSCNNFYLKIKISINIEFQERRKNLRIYNRLKEEKFRINYSRLS